jgi:hypothetical protein
MRIVASVFITLRRTSCSDLRLVLFRFVPLAHKERRISGLVFFIFPNKVISMP